MLDDLSMALKSLEMMVSLVQNVEWLFDSMAAIFLPRFLDDKNLLLSFDEAQLLSQALLRFRLYNQLFHQLSATEKIVSDRD